MTAVDEETCCPPERCGTLSRMGAAPLDTTSSIGGRRNPTRRAARGRWRCRRDTDRGHLLARARMAGRHERIVIDVPTAPGWGAQRPRADHGASAGDRRYRSGLPCIFVPTRSDDRLSAPRDRAGAKLVTRDRRSPNTTSPVPGPLVAAPATLGVLAAFSRASAFSSSVIAPGWPSPGQARAPSAAARRSGRRSSAAPPGRTRTGARLSRWRSRRRSSVVTSTSPSTTITRARSCTSCSCISSPAGSAGRSSAHRQPRRGSAAGAARPRPSSNPDSPSATPLSHEFLVSFPLPRPPAQLTYGTRDRGSEGRRGARTTGRERPRRALRCAFAAAGLPPSEPFALHHQQLQLWVAIGRAQLRGRR